MDYDTRTLYFTSNATGDPRHPDMSVDTSFCAEVVNFFI